MYDFHKSRQEGNENEFSHSSFKRGHKDLLSEIKRKIADPQPPANQLVPVSREIDMDRFKKEAMQFSNDLKSLKTRQTDLEKITKVIFTQNTKLLSENKLLWKELIKNKEKYERKIEKLMIFIFSIMQYSNNNGPKSLGPSETAKSLETGLNGYGDSDQEGGKSMEMPEIPLVMTDKTDHEKFLKKVSHYFQNKDNKSNLDKLIEMAQQGKLPNFQSNQNDLLEAGLDEDGVNYVENLKRQTPYFPSTNPKYTRRTSSYARKNPNSNQPGISNPMSSANDDSMFNNDPTKFMKVDPQGQYGGSNRIPNPNTNNNNDVSMFMQMPQGNQYMPEVPLTTNPSMSGEGLDLFPGQFDRMQSFNFDNPNKNVQQSEGIPMSPATFKPENNFFPASGGFDYSPKGGFTMPNEEIKDPFSLQRQNSDMFLPKDPFDFTRMSSNPPDNMNMNMGNMGNMGGYYNPDNFIANNNNNNNNGYQYDQQIDENFENKNM